MTDETDRRAADQDAAVERAFVAGTLPEDDRRAALPAVPPTETPPMTSKAKTSAVAETTDAVSLFHVYDIMPPGTVPSLDAALDAYAVRLGTPATPGSPFIPGDPLAVPPTADIPAVPPTDAIPATLTDEDEWGVIIKTAAQEQGYAQRTLLRALFDLIKPNMTPLPPLPPPPAADGSAAPAGVSVPASFEGIP